MILAAVVWPVQTVLIRNIARIPGSHFCALCARQVMMPSPRFAVALLVALLSISALFTSSVRAQTTVTSERPAAFSLPNGLHVVVIPDHRTPVVTHMIW